MSSSVVEQIKERLSITDVVSSYVKLEKAGKNLRAKSPFSNERTPSFFVSPERGTYYCFSTGQGGDIFTFVEKMEGVDFKGALKILAERAGVPLTPLSRAEDDKRDRLYRLLEETTRFFEAELEKSPEARQYLKDRGLSEATTAAWRLGFAPASWDALKRHLTKRGYTEAEMEAAGLIKRSDEKRDFYDRFRGRIIFPISDTSGRVIAYTGRILPLEGNPQKPDTAKYLNSPETRLFNKSRVLYGYDVAKQGIRKLNFSILVEGQMDALLSYQAGYKNTVAVSGTALTEYQLDLLSRLSNNLVMAFDADRAGIASAGKGIRLALARGMDVKVAALPKGADPADIVRTDPAAWKRIVGRAKHVIDFYLDYLSAEHKDERKLRLAVRETVIPYLSEIPNRIDQAHFVARVAERMRMKEDPIWEEIRGLRREAPASGIVALEEKAPLAQLRKQTIEERLASILLFEEAFEKAHSGGDAAVSAHGKELAGRLTELLGADRLTELRRQLGADENKVLFEIETLYEHDEARRREVEELLGNLEREVLKESYVRAHEALKAAEVSEDKPEIARLTDECNRLGKLLGMRG